MHKRDVDIDSRVYEYKGLRIAGHGDVWYNDSPFMYTESEMQKQHQPNSSQAFGFPKESIFWSHAPAEGYGDR